MIETSGQFFNVKNLVTLSLFNFTVFFSLFVRSFLVPHSLLLNSSPWLASPIEEGRAGSKSPHEKFGFFLSVSQQAVSADINKSSAVGKTMQDLNYDYWNKHIFSTRKRFEEGVWEETAHLATLKSKNYLSLPKDTAEIETGMAEKSCPGTRQTNTKNLVWFGEIERKLAKLSMPTFTYRSSS